MIPKIMQQPIFCKWEMVLYRTSELCFCKAYKVSMGRGNDDSSERATAIFVWWQLVFDGKGEPCFCHGLQA